MQVRYQAALRPDRRGSLTISERAETPQAKGPRGRATYRRRAASGQSSTTVIVFLRAFAAATVRRPLTLPALRGSARSAPCAGREHAEPRGQLFQLGLDLVQNQLAFGVREPDLDLGCRLFALVEQVASGAGDREAPLVEQLLDS